jgi:hypothetical protein
LLIDLLVEAAILGVVCFLARTAWGKFSIIVSVAGIIAGVIVGIIAGIIIRTIIAGTVIGDFL